MSTFADEVAALRGTKPATLKDLLTHPAFSRLLAAMAVSSLGDWVGFVAVTSLVAGISGGAAGFAIGGVMIARMLPAILFGPFAGALIDRVNRKHVMIIADLGRGAMYASMAFVRTLWAIYLLSFAIECLSLLWSPARDASLPNIVPRRQLANANSIGLVSTYATLPLGGAVFALLAGVSSALHVQLPYMGSHPESLPLLLDARDVHLLRRDGERRAHPGAVGRHLRAIRSLARLARHPRRRPVPARGLHRVGHDRGHRGGLRLGGRGAGAGVALRHVHARMPAPPAGG